MRTWPPPRRSRSGELGTAEAGFPVLFDAPATLRDDGAPPMTPPAAHAGIRAFFAGAFTWNMGLGMTHILIPLYADHLGYSGVAIGRPPSTRWGRSRSRGRRRSRRLKAGRFVAEDRARRRPLRLESARRHRTGDDAMLKWAGITFGIGMLIILLEYNMARKKKEGITWTDRQRMVGIFWISCAMAALVAALIWMAG
jgi:hypothetical protein